MARIHAHTTIAALIAVAAMAPAAVADGNEGTLSAPTQGYAPVNGLELYYEVHGEGAPLVLLHGGLGSSGMFGPVLPMLAEDRQVIAVDLQAHGRTADIDQPMSYQAMADDIAGLIGHLGLGTADVMGYSLGGGVALQTAIRHPELVDRLVVVSAPFMRDGWYPEIRDGMASIGREMAEAMKQTPIYQGYVAIAPRPADWPVLLEKAGAMQSQDYDWREDVAKIAAPILLVYADADAVTPAHAVAFYGLFGGGERDAGWDGAGRPAAQLAILPGLSHYDVFAAPALAQTAIDFLDASR